MKRYLIVAPKQSIAKTVVDVYKKMGESAAFMADVLPINCHVVDLQNNHFSQETLSLFKPFVLKKINITDRFRISCDTESCIERGKTIREFVKKNKYDAIVNACDADTEGELEFQYMIESLGLENIKTERIYLFDITESTIEAELMTLNSF